MIPSTILSNLEALRRREQVVTLIWGLARLFAIALGLLLIACLVDWLVDLNMDTPMWLRVSMFILQIVVALAVAGLFVVWPMWKRHSLNDLALWVEDKRPELGHMLITAVELNRPGAPTKGMSLELIDVVTKEAHSHAQRESYPRIVDLRRLRWSFLSLAPVLIFAILALLIWPEVMNVLFARQMLADREIPRLVALENISDPIQPKGEKSFLRLRAAGAGVGDHLDGQVIVRPEGQPTDRYALALEKVDTDGSAIYVAEVPPSSANLSFTAWLGDGRLKQWAEVQFVPRPVVTEQLAFVQLPAYCGLTPSGKRYEQSLGRGDVTGIPGSTLRLSIKTQKPVETATLLIYGVNAKKAAKKKLAAPASQVSSDIPTPLVALPQENPQQSGAPTDDDVPEIFRRKLPMKLAADGQSAQVLLDLKADETSFQIEVIDSYHFSNEPKPRRLLRIVPEEAPQVSLLKETFAPIGLLLSEGSNEDYEIDNPVIAIGERLQVPYTARGPYGLGQAWFLYRVTKKLESGNDIGAEEPWIKIALSEVTASEDSGPFDPRRGAFQFTANDVSVPFVALASPEPEIILPRTLGGGRYIFQTGGAIDGDGNPRDIKIGEQIEYMIEVFADPEGSPTRPSARSEPRVKTFVSIAEFITTQANVMNEMARLRSLNQRQGGVFERDQ